MKKSVFTPLFTIALLSVLFAVTALAQEDKYQWLEEIEGKQSLEFVNAQNKATLEKLSKEKDYQSIYNKSLEIYNSNDRIAYPTIYGDYVYNTWQDKDHERGIWRRATKASHLSGSPAWETLLDLDDMSKKDSVQWVFKGESGLYPQYNRFMVSLSKGGGDAVVIREFDVKTKSFVENGFKIDEAKGGVSYLDENTLVVSSDFGAGTMTTSGYPRQVKRWKRGTALKEAALLFEGDVSNVACWGFALRDGNKTYVVVSQGLTFFTSNVFVWVNDKKIQLDIPADIQPTALLSGQVVLNLKSDWTVNGTTYKQGAVVSADFAGLLKGQKNLQLVYEPDAFSSVAGVSATKNKLLVNVTTNVKNELYIYTYQNKTWQKTKVDAPDYGTLYVVAGDDLTDDYFINYQNFLIPTSLYAGNAQDTKVKMIKSLPAFFDADKYEVQQFKAKSKDGTLIPYFMIAAKNIKKDGSNPTLLYAYGGFESSETPYYLSTNGTAWLDKGGIYVVANIRGGGEFGPKWHQDGMKEKRQNVFDDLYAVSEDLIAKKVTSPKHLGVIGGSNGGLLVGVAFTQRPDLYNAVVCEVPLLDMKRYNKLLAGASWMGEYGNPDLPEEWEYIKKYSPYQNVKAGTKYPEVFFTTSTRDDRVHPGHARKMVAKMNDMGYKTYYYENTEGGHAGASTNEQRAKLNALTFSYLLMKLKQRK